MVLSVVTHALVAVCAVLLVNLQPPIGVSERAPVASQERVFLDLSGPGGGGGGGGEDAVMPASIAEVVGRDETPTPVPESTTPTFEDVKRTVEPPPVERLPLAPAGQSLVPRVGATMGLSQPVSRGVGTGSGADGGRGPGLGGGEGPGGGLGRGGGTGGDVFDVGNGVTAPERLKEVKPAYTTNAMQAKIQGIVWVEATVLPSGRVADPVVVRSLDRLFGLDGEAIKAVLATPFRPGTKDGRPVAVRVTFELVFSLR
jgi:protein TonB